MFRSLLYDHPQGLSFVLSALPLFRCLHRHLPLFSMWLYAVYVYVCHVYLSVGCLVVNSRPDNPQTGTPDTHSHRHNTHQIMLMTKQTSGKVVMH
jgi:hypothetical protein